jgi:eukaryotic-like serine/threonine-protein kinase
MTASHRRLSAGSLVHDRYRIVAIVGSGGVADVYRATDEQLGRDVALKVIPHGIAGSTELQRVDDEVRLLAGFNHPALVTLYDVLAADDGRSSTLVMQFVEGDDLSAHIARGALPTTEVAEIGTAVAQALAFVHASGVIHRDVKPANILLPASGPQPALLADFGIARLIDSTGVTATGTIIGTASYLSPEQARGATLSDRTDIYSLGLVLLEAVTGNRAFPGSAVESVAARLGGDPEIAADLDHDWSALLARMVDRDPRSRPSAAEVAEELSSLGAPAATRVLPVADAPTERLESAAATELRVPVAATERLIAPVATELLLPAVAPRRSASPAPRRALAGVGVLILLLALAAIIFALTRPDGTPASTPSAPAESAASSSAAPLPTISYPSVDGELGDLLAQLQSAVGAIDNEEIAYELGQRVLAVSDAAAAGDLESARSAVDELTKAVDTAELSAADRSAITDASEAVRKQLDSLIKDAEKPGKGKPDKKP